MAKSSNSLSKLKDEILEFRNLLKIPLAGSFEKLLVNDIASILDTSPIQALQHRLQLGLVYKVLGEEKGKHTRLDHTIGVVAKCIVTADIVNKNTKNRRIKLTEKDVRELAVAACLHDCGHFPVSHATERAFLIAKDLTKGISHEERIIPLIVNRNPYLDELRNIVLSWKNFDENSFYRIACIISPTSAEKYEKNNESFDRPKKAIQQLLVSDIDMDRLDYVIRDAEHLDYKPVKLISDKIIEYVKGLSLEKYKSLNNINNKENVELCLSEELKENVFYLLVSRVLLYKYFYFAEKIRCFEAVLTYLVGTLILKEVALEPLKLIAMSDKEFLDTYLANLVLYLDDKDAKHLTDKYINVLRYDKVERFKKLDNIFADDIANPRLKDEFIENIKKRSYQDNLRTYLSTNNRDIDLEQGDILIDVFHLKTGGGELLVKNHKGDFKTLDAYMNGSNMHKLCSEIRLDIYMKSDLGDKKKDCIKKKIKTFFKYV